MPIYETVFAVPADFSEEERNASISSVEELIKQVGGEVDSSDGMGEKRMAYKVRGYERAYYHIIKFNCPPNAIDELKKNYKINQNYLRNMIIKNG